MQLNTTKHSFVYFALDLLGMSHLDLLVEELTAVCKKWQNIGEELGVHRSSLIYYRHNYPDHDCLRKVVSEQLKSCPTSWKDIVAVLRTPRIGESHLADHLDLKYCSSEFTAQ